MTVHEHVQQTLSAWLDGQADPEQRFLAEQHLQQCKACRATVAAFARVDALAREVLLPAGRLAAEPAHGQQPVRVRHQRLRHRLWLAGVAAVLVVLALVAVSIVVSPAGRWPLPVPTTAPGPVPRQLTLAAVVARAEQVASGVRTLQGRFTRTWSGMPTRSGSSGTVTSSFRFAFASPDRVRVEGGPSAEVRLQINDGPAARRVLWRAEEPRPWVSTGLPLVRPQDQDALAPLSEGLTLWFRNRLEDPNRPASLTRRQGRQVYVLLLRYEWSTAAGPARITHLEVWVDPISYLPVRIQYQDRSKPGRVMVRGDVRYTDQRINGPVPPGAFAVPVGAEVSAVGQFRSMPLARARALASYKVPRIGTMPQPGWQLLRSGYAPVGRPTGSEGLNPPGRDLVVAVYGSGLERVALTTLLVTDQELGHRRYEDPFGGEGIQRVAGGPRRLLPRMDAEPKADHDEERDMSTAQGPEPTQALALEDVAQMSELTPRDATYWAKQVTTLKLGEVPAEAMNLNVAGKRLVGPIQGFGKLWQKTYRAELHGVAMTPAEVVTVWKQSFASFWPPSGRFYGPLTSIVPGDVALLNMSVPGGVRLSTGILVLYADEESFTFMTPQGHMFAAWITFSATTAAGQADEDGVTAVQTQVLLRTNDPLYELSMPIVLQRMEDRFWRQTLVNLARHLGVADPRVTTTAVCLDRRRQWRNAGNLWHNAGIRSALYTLATPLRALRPRRRRAGDV